MILLAIFHIQKLFVKNNFEHIFSAYILDSDKIDSDKKNLSDKIQKYLILFIRKRAIWPMKCKEMQKIVCFVHLCTIFKWGQRSVIGKFKAANLSQTVIYRVKIVWKHYTYIFVFHSLLSIFCRFWTSFWNWWVLSKLWKIV